jgi:hypothetical protein
VGDDSGLGVPTASIRTASGRMCQAILRLPRIDFLRREAVHNVVLVLSVDYDEQLTPEGDQASTLAWRTNTPPVRWPAPCAGHRDGW